MGLIIPRGPDWGFCSHNLAVGSLSVSHIGTAITAGADDADGTAVTVLSALAHDVEYVVIGVDNFFATGGNGSCLLDILFDPAGGTSWLSLIDDLMVGWTIAWGTTAPVPRWFHFPIWIPAGSTVGARVRTSHTSIITTGGITIFAYGGNANPSSWWCGQSVTTLGVEPTTSSGTMVTSGASVTYGSWTNVGTTLPRDCGALQFVVQGQNTTTGTFCGMQFEFGVGEVPIGAPIYGAASSAENGQSTPNGVIFKCLPAGAQIQARGANTTVGTIDFDVAAYAVH